MRKLLWLAIALVAVPAFAQQPVFTPDVATLAVTLDGANDFAVLALNGRAGASFQVKTANLSATLTFYASYDGSVTWQTMNVLTAAQQDSGVATQVVASADVGASLFVPGGATHIRAFVTAYTSGSGTIRLTGTLARVSMSGGLDGSGTLNTVAKFTPDGTTLGNSTITDTGTVVTVNGATTARAAPDGSGAGAYGFLNVTGTLPASFYSQGSVSSYTVNSASTGLNHGLYAELIGSDTTTSYQAAGYFDNRVLNSSTGILYGIYSSSSGATGATRIGLQTDGAGGTASSRGVYGTATSATGYLVGGDFRAFGAGTKIGVAGILSSVTEIASPVATAALFDNSSVAAPIAIFRDNSTTKVSIEDGGKLLLASGNYIEGTEAAAPGAPAAGQVILYAKSGAPGEWCSLDDAAVETCMSAGSGGSGLSYAQVAAAVLAGL